MSAAEHPDWAAFLAAIVADPDDDTARLVAADFLEENGDADRAAFIRIQVELARLEATGQGKSLEADHLRAKERAFLGPLSMFRQLWAAEACPELVRVVSRGGGRDPLEAMTVEGADRLTWRRGFVEGVSCSAARWFQHGATVRMRQPIRVVELHPCHEINWNHWHQMLPTLATLKCIALHGFDNLRAMQEWLRPRLPDVTILFAPASQ